MAYADYSFYQDRGGQMSASDFLIYSKKASDYIDYITSDNAAAYTDTDSKLKKCCCELADEIKKNEKQNNVASESIGSYSVSFSDTSDEALRKRLAKICVIYIGSTGLMYRGL